MKSAELTQFLIDVTRGHRKNEFMNDVEHVLSTSILDDATRAAVRTQDIGALWLAGAHPMALMYFARACGWANERYYGCLSDADAAKAAQSASAQ